MAADRRATHDQRVVEVLISFQRPDSLSETDMRSWLNGRRATGPPVIALGIAGGREEDGLLRARVPAGSPTAEEQLADLMMDMHLLGLRPAVVSDPRLGTTPEDG